MNNSLFIKCLELFCEYLECYGLYRQKKNTCTSTIEKEKKKWRAKERKKYKVNEMTPYTTNKIVHCIRMESKQYRSKTRTKMERKKREKMENMPSFVMAKQTKEKTK